MLLAQDPALIAYVRRYQDMVAALSSGELESGDNKAAAVVQQLFSHLVLCVEEITSLNQSLAKVSVPEYVGELHDVVHC